MSNETPSFESVFMKKSGKYVPDKEVMERFANLSPEMQRKILDQVDKLDPSTPWDIKPKFSMEGDEGWESEEKEAVVPEAHMPGDGGWTYGSWKPIGKSIREMIARNCFEKTGRIPDVEFMDTYEVKKAANETDINDLQGAASDEQPRGYGDVDKFGNSHHFSDERKAISDRVNTINPKRLNPGYERPVGTTGILDTPTDVGVELGDDVLNSAKSKGENPDAYLNFMRGPNSKAVIGVMKKHGFTDEEIQSTLKQVLNGYDYSEDYMDTY